MPPSVMPKGVEHNSLAHTRLWALGVPPSVMPKGVEHPQLAYAIGISRPVPPSVMPKGVEHLAESEALKSVQACRPP